MALPLGPYTLGLTHHRTHTTLHDLHFHVPTLPKQYLDPLSCSPSNHAPPLHWQDHIHLTHFYASPALAMHANTTIASESRVCFDTDSGEIGVDNRCTACISHDDPHDFEPYSLKPTNRVVKGFAGLVTANVQVGTLVWTWENDERVSTTFHIPNSYYVPSVSVGLLSPQHWAQTQWQSIQDRTPTIFTEHTDGLQCILTWDQGRSRRTIPLSRSTNVATFCFPRSRLR
jgi:hypothetical protein